MSATVILSQTNTITLTASTKPPTTRQPQSNKSRNSNRKTRIFLEEDIDDPSKFILHYNSDKIPAREDILEWVVGSLFPSSIDERVELQVVLSGRMVGGEPQMVYEFGLNDVEGRNVSKVLIA